MGAWFCEGEGCDAVVPGAHPIEQGDKRWDPNEPMLCRACTYKAAFEVLEKLIVEDGLFYRSPHELRDVVRKQRKRVNRMEAF